MTVYLLHFTQPIGDPENPHGSAQHYIGWALDLDARIADHRAGRSGAAIMDWIAQAGIGFTLARTWSGDRKLERKLKDRKASPRLCPLCAGPAAWRRANHEGD